MKQKILLAVLLTAMLFTACKEEFLAPDISGIETADYVLNIGDKLTLAPNITNLKGNDYVWYVNEKKVANATTDYTFVAVNPGTFVVTFKASNKGGAADKAFKIVVEKPIDISFDQAIYVTPKSNVVEIAPKITGPERNDYTYEWMLGDEVLGKKKNLEFITITPGKYELKLIVSAGKQTQTTTVNVKVEDADYFKYATTLVDVQFAAGKSSWRYPFGTEAGSFASPYEEYKQKLSNYIQNKPSAELNIGEWGGYAVYGFDHTIANVPSESDIQVTVTDYSQSETAFFVAYDRNKNGKPDEDEWYEIKSANFGVTQIKDYKKTFTYNGIYSGNNIEYEWKDSETNGKIEANFNRFPGCDKKDNKIILTEEWKNTFTLSGRRIITRAQMAFTPNKTYNIDINNAVNKNDEPIFLPGVDFLKVQNICVMYWKDELEPYMYYKGQKISGIEDKHL